MPLRPVAVLAPVALLAACASTAPARTAAPAAVPPPVLATVSTLPGAQVVLAPASASLVSGRLRLVPSASGVRLTGEIGGLQRNRSHAIHIHEHGDCSAADASSAGGHFNPARQPHGRAGAGPHHGGDLDNLAADASGVARVDLQAAGVVLGGGAANDVIGRAVVVHALADDYRSQPAGNAGGRVACGVIRAGG